METAWKLFKWAIEIMKPKSFNRLLSLLFSIAITTAILQRSSPELLLNLSNADKFHDFFFNGYYIIPVSVFMFILIFLRKSFNFFFKLVTGFLFVKNFLAINNYKLTQYDHDTLIRKINKLPWLRLSIDTPKIVELYYQLKNNSDFTYNYIKGEMNAKKRVFKTRAYLSSQFLASFLLSKELWTVLGVNCSFVFCGVAVSILLYSLMMYVIVDIIPLIIKKADVEIAAMISGEYKIVPLVKF